MTPTDTPAAATAGDATGPRFGELLQRYLLPVGLCAAPSGDIFAHRAVLERNKQALRRWNSRRIGSGSQRITGLDYITKHKFLLYSE
jgi:hypothetical protein